MGEKLRLRAVGRVRMSGISVGRFLFQSLRRVVHVIPLAGDFLGLWLWELAHVPVALFFTAGFLAITSVAAFAAGPNDAPIGYWFQGTSALDLAKFITDRPFSLTTLILVIFFGTRIYTRMIDEHEEVRKKLGLIPSHRLTDAEKEGIVVSAAKLRASLQEQSNWIDDRFVTLEKYEMTTKEVKAQLQKILERGRHVRKGDEPDET